MNSDFEISDEELDPCDQTNVLFEENDDIEVDERNDPTQQSWTSGPHIPIVYEFDEFQSGVTTNNLTANSRELCFFEHFLNLEIMNEIVIETNKFYLFKKSQTSHRPKSRIHKWINTTVPEMYIFFAVSMLITRNKHMTIEEHWSTHPYLENPIFRKIMSRDRYQLLLQMLHFSDPYVINSSRDKLIKIRTLLQYTRKFFKETMIPYKNLCIDESIVVFKGRLMFKQYMPSKRHRFGIKMFVLCDVTTNYILDFIIYCGEGTDIVDSHNIGVSGAVVSTLLNDYLGKGHTLWCDNWYSSPVLFKYLHDEHTNACGTVRKNRKGMPNFKKLKKGESESKKNGPLLALKWCDRRDVHMLTTLHSDSFEDAGKVDFKSGELIKKPSCIIQYNKNMGAVDKTDMMLSGLSCMRKSLKWYKKVSFHIIDLFLLNAHCIYTSITGSKKTLAEFQLCVIQQLVEKYKKHINPLSCSKPSTSRHDFRILPKSATDHFPELIQQKGTSKKPRMRCHVCGNSKTEKKV